MNIFKSFFNLNIFCSVSTPYRLFKKLKLNQHIIRENLLKIKPPPENKSDNPVLLTIKHLKETFNAKDQCPIQAFQHTFQTSIF